MTPLNGNAINDALVAVEVLETYLFQYIERRELEVGPGDAIDLDHAYDVEQDIRNIKLDLNRLREALR